MRNRRTPLIVLAITVAIILGSVELISPQRLRAAGSYFLAGSVQSSSGQKLGGVTISAKAEGENITTSVFTDDEGNYYFPAMNSNKYRVWAQAIGFENGDATVELTGSRHQDFVLHSTDNFTKQMTGDQYLAALPEDTPEDRRLKAVFKNNCTDCHEPSYTLQNRFDEQGWNAILNLMRRISSIGVAGNLDVAPAPIIQYQKKELAAYLARMRGPDPSPMHFKPRPRPSGDAARVIYTEYDIPLDTQTGGYTRNNGSDWSLGTPSRLSDNHGPHDVEVDFHGNVWFTDNMANTMRTFGKVDTETGKIKDFKLPGVNGLVASTHGMTRDKNGIIWFNIDLTAAEDRNSDGSLGRVDPNTDKVEVFTPPKGMRGVGGTLDTDKDGNVWASTGSGAIRFDPKTQQFKEYHNVTDVNTDGSALNYGMATDSEGNGWWTLINLDRIDKADVHTGKLSEVKLDAVPGQKEMLTPQELKMYELSGGVLTSHSPWLQGPRRIAGDKNGDVLWAADYYGGNLARIDIHSLKVDFVPLPDTGAAPYGASVDTNHDVWVPLKNSGQIAKYDPKISQWTVYDLPTLGAMIRYVSLLESHGNLEEVAMGYSKTSKVAVLKFRTREDIEALKNQIKQ